MYRRTVPLLTVVVLTIGCGLTDLFNGEDHDFFAHTDIGYPMTAYVEVPDSLTVARLGWPDPPDHEIIDGIIRSGTQAAIERWSLALRATPSRQHHGHVARVAADFPDLDWPYTVAETITGFHVIIIFGSLHFAWHNGTYSDESDNRPVVGVIGLNIRQDWSIFHQEGIETIIAHEIGHALGFHLPFDRGIVDRLNERAGAIVATRLPVTGSHWEDCMRPDLMTATAIGRRGQRAYISNLTIEAMNYPWQYNEADVEHAHKWSGAPPVCWRVKAELHG